MYCFYGNARPITVIWSNVSFNWDSIYLITFILQFWIFRKSDNYFDILHYFICSFCYFPFYSWFLISVIVFRKATIGNYLIKEMLKDKEWWFWNCLHTCNTASFLGVLLHYQRIVWYWKDVLFCCVDSTLCTFCTSQGNHTNIFSLI